MGIISNALSFVFTFKYFDVFHIRRLRVLASTLSDFRRSIREVWTTDCSFPCPWFSQWLHIFGIAYWIVTRSIYFFSHPRHPVELWTFEMWLSKQVWLLENLRKKKCESFDVFDENQTAVPCKLFMTPCCLERKVDFSISFHIQGIHICVIIPSDFHCLARAAWRDNFSLRLLWYSHSLYLFDVPYFIVVIDIHFILNHGHTIDSWTFQIGYRTRVIGLLVNLRRRTFKQWIRNRRAGSIKRNKVGSGQVKCSPSDSPGREFSVDRMSWPQGKVWGNVKRNCRAFWESLIQLIHSQIIPATTEWPSRTSPGAPSLVDALRPTNPPQPTLYQLTQFPCAAKQHPRVSVDDGPRGKWGRRMRYRGLVRTEPDAAAGRYRMVSGRGKK
jgi:hypothetical protein